MESISSNTTKKMVDHLFREESGKMTAILIRLFGLKKAELAEDIVQETFISAMKKWPLKGVPENPAGWLMQVAKNKAINVVNREQRIKKLNSVLELPETEAEIETLFIDREIRDSQLNMLFICCYSEIGKREQIMLILKILGGFNNREIGSALLMTPQAVKKAIYRAKKEIHNNYEQIPSLEKKQLEERIDTVYTAIYLIFNEGYKTSYGQKSINEDLCFTGLRLAKLLLEIENVNHGKTHALLSLMCFNIARFPARKEDTLGMMDLKNQKRERWDANLINTGFHHLKASRGSNELSRYHLESAIASIHCSAKTFEDTDWNAIAKRYEQLLKIDSTAIIKLNYVISMSHLNGPEYGLNEIDAIDFSKMKDKQHLLHAAKAEMYARLKKFDLAKSYYQVACDMALSKADMEFLLRKIEECDKRNISQN